MSNTKVFMKAKNDVKK